MNAAHCTQGKSLTFSAEKSQEWKECRTGESEEDKVAVCLQELSLQAETQNGGLKVYEEQEYRHSMAVESPEDQEVHGAEGDGGPSKQHARVESVRRTKGRRRRQRAECIERFEVVGGQGGYAEDRQVEQVDCHQEARLHSLLLFCWPLFVCAGFRVASTTLARSTQGWPEHGSLLRVRGRDGCSTGDKHDRKREGSFADLRRRVTLPSARAVRKRWA